MHADPQPQPGVSENPRLVVGLTGGIGSGKSAVCREFERLGVPIVDADVVSREVVALGSIGLKEVVSTFGNGIVNTDGSIDRDKLRSLVFQDDAKRTALEAILHPKIRERIHVQLAAITSSYCIICVPLLVEKDGYQDLDRILVVDCPRELQIARVMERDNLTRNDVEAIMRSQATRQERLRLANDIIDNADRMEDLKISVEAHHKQYMAIAEQLRQEQQSNAEQREQRAK
ncbi:MAG: dephospho-CoA kinase [Proteobacteria bacterium]|nr:MAG: dephospho-CoA kinase [Pseudomonadota bacterium]